MTGNQTESPNINEKNCPNRGPTSNEHIHISAHDPFDESETTDHDEDKATVHETEVEPGEACVPAQTGQGQSQEDKEENTDEVKPPSRPVYEHKSNIELIDTPAFIANVLNCLKKSNKLTSGNQDEIRHHADLVCTCLNDGKKLQTQFGDAAYEIQKITELSSTQVAEIIFDAAGQRCPYDKSWICRLIKDSGLRQQSSEYAGISDSVSHRLATAPLLSGNCKGKFDHVIKDKVVKLADFKDAKAKAIAKDLFTAAGNDEEMPLTADRHTVAKVCSLLAGNFPKEPDPSKLFIRQLKTTIDALNSLNATAVTLGKLEDLAGNEENSSKLLHLAKNLAVRLRNAQNAASHQRSKGSSGKASRGKR